MCLSVWGLYVCSSRNPPPFSLIFSMGCCFQRASVFFLFGHHPHFKLFFYQKVLSKTLDIILMLILRRLFGLWVHLEVKYSNDFRIGDFIFGPPSKKLRAHLMDSIAWCWCCIVTYIYFCLLCLTVYLFKNARIYCTIRNVLRKYLLRLK